MNPIAKARLLGAMLAATTFAAGVAVGMALAARRPHPAGVTMIPTDQIPQELERLSLTDGQRRALAPILRRGRDRVIGVIDQFTPFMQTAADSTDAEIRVVLDARQRAAFDSARRASPRLRRVTHRK